MDRMRQDLVRVTRLNEKRTMELSDVNKLMKRWRCLRGETKRGAFGNCIVAVANVGFGSRERLEERKRKAKREGRFVFISSLSTINSPKYLNTPATHSR